MDTYTKLMIKDAAVTAAWVIPTFVIAYLWYIIITVHILGLNLD